nr:MAG TPA: hypothetical protein [Inoviridae sp.]
MTARSACSLTVANHHAWMSLRSSEHKKCNT